VVDAEEGVLTAVEEDAVEEEEAEMVVEEEMVVIAEGEVGAAVEEDARLRFKLKVSRMGIMHVANEDLLLKCTNVLAIHYTF